MAEKPEDLNLPAAVITRMIKEVVRGTCIQFNRLNFFACIRNITQSCYKNFKVRL